MTTDVAVVLHDRQVESSSAHRRRGGRQHWLLPCLVALLGVCTASGYGHHAVTRRAVAVAVPHAGAPPFFGINVPGAAPRAFDDLADELGVRPTVSSIFIKLDSSNALDGLAAIPAGVTPFVTLEPWSRTGRRGEVDQPRYSLRSLADGAHDQALRRVAAALVALHRPVYLRFAHEMNGNWYPWSAAVNGNDPERYVQAWRHVHRIIGAITGPAVRWVWSPNITTGLPRGMPSLRSMYPGNEWVDYVGVTGYSRGPSPRDTFCPTLSALAAFSDKPVVLSEIGVDGPDKLPWLEHLGTFVSADPTIAGFIYFNTSSDTTDASGNYRVDESPASLKALGLAVHEAMTSPRGSAATAGLSCT